MGKASKWIRNFLIAKKEQEDKKQTSFPVEFLATQTAILPATPKVKRRWSFGRSTGKQIAHKCSKSVDSIDIITVPIQAMTKSETLKNQTMALAVVGSGVEDAAATKIQAIIAESEAWKSRAMAMTVACNDVEDAAATKIQAIFRSFLARKALCALRGLVKLQALFRGHLVRKQTSATLRRMHALMAIQVRARVQRIQMAEETQLVVKRQSSVHRNFTQDNGFRKPHRETTDVNLTQRKNTYLNHLHIERIEHGPTTTYCSGDLSISKQEHQIQEYSFSAQNSPQHHPFMSRPKPTRPTSTFSQPESKDSMSRDFIFVPNYMANTESSRAKVRSQSEPKQRPKWRQKSRRTPSMEGVPIPQDVQLRQRSPSHASTTARRSQDPWIVKLYRSRMFVKDNEGDSTSTATTNSNYCTSLVAFEPHLTLY